MYLAMCIWPEAIRHARGTEGAAETSYEKRFGDIELYCRWLIV